MLFLHFFLQLVLAQYEPTLPNCNALATDGSYFDWSALNKTFIVTFTENGVKMSWESVICGTTRYCDGTGCGFCSLGTYLICVGYTNLGPGNDAIWAAQNSYSGSVSYYRNYRSGIVNIYCDPSLKEPIIQKQQSSQFYDISYKSSEVCPIGTCPKACNFFSGYGSCNPKNGFSCSCNIGFSGVDCGESTVNIASTTVSGTWKEGTVAGGPSVTLSFLLFSNDGASLPCYKSDLPWSSPQLGNYPSCDPSTGRRTYTFSSTTSGVHGLSVSLYDQQIPGSPFSVIVSPGILDPNNTVASGSGLSSAIVGSPAVFRLATYDHYKNEETLCTPETSYFYGSLYGPTSVEVQLSCSAGVITGTYTVTQSGNYQLIVRYKEQIIHGFPTLVVATTY